MPAQGGRRARVWWPRPRVEMTEAASPARRRGRDTASHRPIRRTDTARLSGAPYRYPLARKQLAVPSVLFETYLCKKKENARHHRELRELAPRVSDCRLWPPFCSLPRPTRLPSAAPRLAPASLLRSHVEAQGAYDPPEGSEVPHARTVQRRRGRQRGFTLQ